MALCVYDDQFVPTLIPCSTASFRLKKIRLPSTHKRMGLPSASRTTDKMRADVNLMFTMSKREQKITLGAKETHQVRLQADRERTRDLQTVI